MQRSYTVSERNATKSIIKLTVYCDTAMYTGLGHINQLQADRFNSMQCSEMQQINVAK